MSFRFLAVDDERLILNRLERCLEQVSPGSEVRGFTIATQALQEIEENGFRPHVAFLDIEMPGLTGLEMAKRLRELSPGTKIIFVTGYSQYALEAFAVHAKGYLVKPVTVEKIQAELAELREVGLPSAASLQVRCFGNFEVFFQGKPLTFSRSRGKELLAYLIHKRGSACTVKELAAVLFEEREYSVQVQNYLQKIIAAMMKTLAQVGAEGVVNKQYNSLAINTSAVDCDFYRFFRLEPDAVNSYMGEYMAQYSWAEFTLGYLDQIVR